jgi:thiosulfate/3-mercaptopyruvate sulfurtransferase
MTGYANPDVLVETQWVAEHLDDPSIRIIEANFDREAYETGHIPGALAWTWNDYQHPVRNDIQDKEGWEALLSRSGIAKDTTLVLYEQSRNWYSIFGFWLLTMYGHEDIRIMNGGRSVTIWFVLKCLLGYPHVRLYDGSWLEWGGSIGVPIESSSRS